MKSFCGAFFKKRPARGKTIFYFSGEIQSQADGFAVILDGFFFLTCFQVEVPDYFMNFGIGGVKLKSDRCQGKECFYLFPLFKVAG